MQVCVVSVCVFVLCIEGRQVWRQAGPETGSWIGALPGKHAGRQPGRPAVRREATGNPFSSRTVLQKEHPGVLLGEHPHHHRLPVGTEQRLKRGELEVVLLLLRVQRLAEVFVAHHALVEHGEAVAVHVPLGGRRGVEVALLLLEEERTRGGVELDPRAVEGGDDLYRLHRKVVVVFRQIGDDEGDVLLRHHRRGGWEARTRWEQAEHAKQGEGPPGAATRVCPFRAAAEPIADSARRQGRKIMWLLDRDSWGREKSVARLAVQGPVKAREGHGTGSGVGPKTEGKRELVMAGGTHKLAVIHRTARVGRGRGSMAVG